MYPSFKSIYSTVATFARWLSYYQSSNPIIHSNWTRCFIVLHSDTAHLHCPSERCQNKAEKKGAGRFQIIEINRSSCAQFSPRQLLKPAPLAVRSDRNPLDAFVRDSSVFLGAFNIVSDRLPANDWTVTDLALRGFSNRSGKIAWRRAVLVLRDSFTDVRAQSSSIRETTCRWLLLLYYMWKWTSDYE